jgi:sigma-E factor negative regulatory protein RseA
MKTASDEHLSQLSALADGQLHGAAFAQQMAELDEDEPSIERWHSYHVVGEIMRSGAAGAAPLDQLFLQNLRLQLKQESTNLIALHAYPTSVAATNDAKKSSANEHYWRLLAGFASLALVGVVAWQALSTPGLSDNNVLVNAPIAAPVASVVAQSVMPAANASGPAVMLRDAQLDALLAAHRQFGGTSAFQTPAGFLRNATFEVQR